MEAENIKKASFSDAPENLYQWSWSLEIVPETEKWRHKTLKH
jgi:hypothetical protein